MLLWSRKPRTWHKRQFIQILVHYQYAAVTIFKSEISNHTSKSSIKRSETPFH